MDKKKKAFIIAASLIGACVVACIIFVIVMLSRVSYVSVDEANKRAEEAYENMLKEQEAQKAQAQPADPQTTGHPNETGEPTLDPDSDTLEFEQYDPSKSSDIVSEVYQSQLSQSEQAIMNETKKRSEVFNILLIGVDRRSTKNEPSRSDSMMIATIDAKNNRLKLTSIMRDLYVPIPGKGSNRINAACTAGGPGLVMKTINQNFNTDIENYVLVDFFMFEKIVDYLGGIPMNLSRGEVSEANDCIAGLNKQRKDPLRDGFITKREGDIILTGKQALGYCRMRHFGDGDFSRTSRQAKALQVILNMFLTADPVKQSQILYDILPMIETNLTSTQLLSLSTQVLSMGVKDIMHYRLPVQGKYKTSTVRGMWVLVPNIKTNAQALHEFLYEATQIDPIEGSDTQAGTNDKKSSKKKATTAPTDTPEPSAQITPADSQDATDNTESGEEKGDNVEVIDPTDKPTPEASPEKTAADKSASDKNESDKTSGSSKTKAPEKTSSPSKETKNTGESSKSNIVPRKTSSPPIIPEEDFIDISDIPEE